MSRVDVRKTYKLYIGGAFPRSESGHSYVVNDSKGKFVANAALASRKDARDAVGAARKAFGGWAGRTAYNRGQILYRVAEIMEGRRAQLHDELADAGAPDPAREVDVAIDRWVWYAGWADKIAQVAGGTNPVAGPYFDFTIPEPVGVVGIVAPDTPALLGFVSLVAPALCAGNAVVVLASETNPLVAITLAEILATSDLPGGVVNVLTGSRDEVGPWLAGHGDVDAIDVTGASPALAATLEATAADDVKRVVRPLGSSPDWFDGDGESPYAVTATMELKTVWHPKGA
jgi:acyl-CoA reductase-like NAD-dependent aldehyde dehydrogenase